MTSDHARFVLDQLAELGRLYTRRMFGGVGIYCDEIFFAIIYQDVLYLKVADVSCAAFLRAGSIAFKPFARRSARYYSVPADSLDDSARMGACCGCSRAPPASKKTPCRLVRQSL